jgi:hypothetical protein
MEERVDSEINKLERQEEDGTINCAGCIIHELNLNLSERMVSENGP